MMYYNSYAYVSFYELKDGARRGARRAERPPGGGGPSAACCICSKLPHTVLSANSVKYIYIYIYIYMLCFPSEPARTTPPQSDSEVAVPA